MAAIVWDPQTWAEQQFTECRLGDRRRNKRLIKLAVKVLARPEASTPQQTETNACYKAAGRLFSQEDVTHSEIIAPHCRATRACGKLGDVKLIVCDTTELDFTGHRKTTGLGQIGNGRGRGMLLHSALMVDARSGHVHGLAAQEIYYRPLKDRRRRAKNTRRRSADRESAVWGRVIEQVGSPPPGVTWLHVCDRGADDLEVFYRALHLGCGFVIRASHLNRKVLDDQGRPLPLSTWLAQQPGQGQQRQRVRAKGDQPAREAVLTLRYGQVRLPRPKVLTPWLKEHLPREPLRLSVVELREDHPPPGVTPLRWVLYTTEAVPDCQAAERVIEHYESRWQIEDYHKCLKTGCSVERRRNQTAKRLEAVTGLLAVTAVRLLQLRKASADLPDDPAEWHVPPRWVQLLAAVRKLPPEKAERLTIREFVRQLAGLGGHLLRKCDGEPGWITLWRGLEKLQLMHRGLVAMQKCG